MEETLINTDWIPEVIGYCAYILFCKKHDGTCIKYKGFTRNFKQRMISHFYRSGSVTTRIFKPQYILHYESFNVLQEATARERFFKTSAGATWIKENMSNLKTIFPTGTALDS